MLQQLGGFLAVFFGVTAAVAELRHYRQGVNGEAEPLQPVFDQGGQVAGLEHATEGTSLLSTSFSRSRVTVSEVPFAGKRAPGVRMETVTLGTLSAICAAMAYLGNDIGEPVCGDVKAKTKSMFATSELLKPISVEASRPCAEETNQTKPEDLNCNETYGITDGKPDADVGSGMDVCVDSGSKVQTLDKAPPVRLRRPPSFHSRLTLIDEANAETISVTSQTRSRAISRPLPAPGDFQRLFRDTRQAFVDALEDLEKEEWENRLQSPEGTGLFRESQKAFTSALEDIEAEDRLRCPSFVSVN